MKLPFILCASFSTMLASRSLRHLTTSSVMQKEKIRHSRKPFGAVKCVLFMATSAQTMIGHTVVQISHLNAWLVRRLDHLRHRLQGHLADIDFWVTVPIWKRGGKKQNSKSTNSLWNSFPPLLFLAWDPLTKPEPATTHLSQTLSCSTAEQNGSAPVCAQSQDKEEACNTQY